MRHSRLLRFLLLGGVILISPAQSQEANERIDQLEQQVRQLTGQVELLTFELKKLRGDSDRARASQAASQVLSESGATVANAEPTVPAAPAAATQVTDVAASGEIEFIEDAPGAQVLRKPLATGASIYDGGEVASGRKELEELAGQVGLSTRKSAQPGDGGFQGVIVDPGTEAPGHAQMGVDGEIERVALRVDSPEALYKQSDEALLRRQFDTAAAGFRQFLDLYPDHNLAGSAQFWLGETYYAQGDFRTAAQNYLNAYKRYPKSRRAPDSLLKLGLALNKLGQREQGCAALGSVSQEYPKAVEAKKRAQLEFRRAGC